MTLEDVVEKVKEKNLELLTIKVRCKKCGNTWGISLDEYVTNKRFICLGCLDKSN
jgi:formylmethanofuran dehydrogenase subunit E